MQVMNAKKSHSSLRLWLIAGCLPLILTACTHYGPKTIQRDRMD
jgi:hypothetical protein